jgi:cytochrome b
MKKGIKAMASVASETRVHVWDPLVRVAHWALVAVFATAYLTGETGRERSDLHELAGYATGGIVAWRIVWGINGPEYARFSSFVTGPRAALHYAFALLRGTARRYLGHEPSGGAMIVALLACLALTVLTGVTTNRGRAPLAQGDVTVSQQQGTDGNSSVLPSSAPQHPGASNALAKVHRVLANITFALIVFHVLGVLVACFVHRENLVTAMISGKKRPETSSE